jgi:flavin-dependent dehydrogenase
LFGFKTHFTGPVDDAVELFFFNGCYVGVNVVESGRTNVCGLGPENHLKECAFDYDRVVRESPALAARLAPLTRDMKWISTGPLVYGQKFEPDGRSYLAGDALSFVDPFTGSGLLAAVKTGAMAGTAASRNDPVDSYLRECRASLKKPFEVAGIFRKAVESGWGEVLAGLIPGRILFALTRPGR